MTPWIWRSLCGLHSRQSLFYVSNGRTQNMQISRMLSTHFTTVNDTFFYRLADMGFSTADGRFLKLIFILLASTWWKTIEHSVCAVYMRCVIYKFVVCCINNSLIKVTYLVYWTSHVPYTAWIMVALCERGPFFCQVVIIIMNFIYSALYIWHQIPKYYNGKWQRQKKTCTNNMLKNRIIMANFYCDFQMKKLRNENTSLVYNIL